MLLYQYFTINYIFSTTFTLVPPTIATPYAPYTPLYNPAPTLTTITTSILILKQQETNYNTICTINAIIGHYSWVGQAIQDILESRTCKRYVNARLIYRVYSVPTPVAYQYYIKQNLVYRVYHPVFQPRRNLGAACREYC